MSDSQSVLTWLEGVDIENQAVIEHDDHRGLKPATKSRKRQLGPSQPRPQRATRRLKALGESCGNIMPLKGNDQTENEPTSVGHRQASPVKKRQSKQPQPSTPAKKSQARQPRQVLEDEEADQSVPAAYNNIYKQETMDSEDATPRPRTLRKSRIPEMPPPDAADDAPLYSSSRGSTKDDVSSTRSRSPVKKMADLKLAQRPTRYGDLDGSSAEVLGGFLQSYARLVRISRGEKVIPRHLRKSIEGQLHKHDWPSDFHYMASGTDDSSSRSYQTSWPERLRDLSEQAKECVRESLAEPSWNAMVHGGILRLVTKNPKYNGLMDCADITVAQIQPKSLSPVHISGNAMQSKLVDFAVFLKTDRVVEERILRLIAKFPKNAQSINQTMYSPLRRRPIGFNIETKPPFTGGETADVQLATWVGAGMQKLSETMGMQGKDVEVPTLPVLTFYGHDLYLSAIQGGAGSNTLYGQLPIGTTRNLLGAFQIVAALDLLVEWAHTDYRSWFESILN